VKVGRHEHVRATQIEVTCEGVDGVAREVHVLHPILVERERQLGVALAPHEHARAQ
jgi:hypothetical protein